MSVYPVLDAYATVQGEGCRTAGEPIWLIRFGTLAAWYNAHIQSTRPTPYLGQTAEEMVNNALEYAPRTVHFTGDDPLLTNIEVLIDAFQTAGFKISLDTCGAFMLPPHQLRMLHHLSVGPKPGLWVQKQYLGFAHEWRFYVKTDNLEFEESLQKFLTTYPELKPKALIIPYNLSEDTEYTMQVAMSGGLRFHIPLYRAIPDFDAHLNGGEICPICLINDQPVQVPGPIDANRGAVQGEPDSNVKSVLEYARSQWSGK